MKITLRKLLPLILALVILATFALVAARQDIPAGATAWEYLYISYAVDPQSDNANIEDVITAELNSYGADGWELVSNQLVPGTTLFWTFKRPVG